MEAIAKGILSGLGYGLLIGPLFFLNIRVTLSQGFQHGMALIAGAFASDLALVLACWWSAEKLAAVSNNSFFQGWFGLVCGLMLFGFGLSAVWPRKHRFDHEMAKKITRSKRRYSFIQGFFINSSNPSNWLFWLSVAAVAKSQAAEGDEQYSRLFMAASLVALFSTDLAKAIIAHKVGRRLKPGLPEKIVAVAGVILIGLSLWIMWTVIQNWGQ